MIRWLAVVLFSASPALAAEFKCPAGLTPAGGTPPKAFTQYCKKGDVTTGPYWSYYKTGEVFSKGSYANNFVDGEWEYFDKSAKLVNKGRFRSGVLYALDFLVAPVETITWVDQKDLECPPNSNLKKFEWNGDPAIACLSKKSTKANTLIDGFMVELQAEENSFVPERNVGKFSIYKDNKLVSFTKFYPSGKKEAEGSVIDGKIVGKAWDKNGKEVGANFLGAPNPPPAEKNAIK